MFILNSRPRACYGVANAHGRSPLANSMEVSIIQSFSLRNRVHAALVGLHSLFYLVWSYKNGLSLGMALENISIWRKKPHLVSVFHN